MTPASTPTGRRERLLDEAIGLVAGGGLAAVTHRSVENAAGAPHGSVTYWFGSRDGLVAAMVERLLAECEGQVSVIAESVAAAFAEGSAPDIEAVVDGLMSWIDDNREIHLARLELELAAVRDPRLAERMRDAANVFWRMCEPLALALGSEDPERDGRAMAAMVDGLLLDRLSHPPQTRDLLVNAVGKLLAPSAPRSA